MATALTISSPKSYQVFQRGGDGKANISITGTYTGAAPVTLWRAPRQMSRPTAT